MYVHCVRKKGETIRSSISALMSTVEDTLTGREGPCVIAGDFNTSTEADREHLVDMMDAFGFVPSLPQGGHCRPTHAKGGVLDWIFSRSMTSSVLHINEQERDHHILSATLRRTYREPEMEELVRINYGGLQKLSAEARAALQQDMEETMATADPENVVEVIRAVALKHLGRAKPPRRRVPKEWMSLQVRARHREYRQATRRHRRCGTQHTKASVKEAHTAFRRELRRAKETSRQAPRDGSGGWEKKGVELR